MEEFQEMLRKNAALPKGQDGKPTPGKFELHKVERDSEGKERYIKTAEDDAIFKAKMAQMHVDSANELKGATFEERWQWVQKCKDEGNAEYKKQNFPEAMDKYIKSLCGLDFGKEATEEQKKDVDAQLKIPILNNLAICLIQLKRYPQALQMTDQVLRIDPANEKALMRRSTALVEFTEFDKAEKVLKQLEDLLATSKNEQGLREHIGKTKARIAKFTAAQERFSKKIFDNKQSLYDEKPNAKTKEEEAKELEEKEKEEAIAKKNQEIKDEAEYLETVSTLQWLIYPFFKTAEKLVEKICGGCKSQRRKREEWEKKQM